MIHSIYNQDFNSTLSIEEGNAIVGFRIINENEPDNYLFHSLDKTELHNLIGLLLHIQSKMRK